MTFPSKSLEFLFIIDKDDDNAEDLNDGDKTDEVVDEIDNEERGVEDEEEDEEYI